MEYFANKEQYIEKKRKAASTTKSLSHLISIAVYIVFAIYMFTQKWRLNPNAFLWFISALALTILLEKVFPSYFKKQYEEAYKMVVVDGVLKRNFKNYKYQSNEGITYKYLCQMGVINKVASSYLDYKTEDLITGIYNDVEYKQADVTFYDRSNKNRYTYIDGRVAEFSYDKEIDFPVVICQKSFKYPCIKDLEKVETENILFNQMFDVYAGNPETAFYILTPQFMECIQNLYKEGRLYIKFVCGKVFVVCDRVHGVFEANINERFDLAKESQKAYEDMKNILAIIDTLRLDKSVSNKTKERNQKQLNAEAEKKASQFGNDDLDAYLASFEAEDKLNAEKEADSFSQTSEQEKDQEPPKFKYKLKGE